MNDGLYFPLVFVYFQFGVTWSRGVCHFLPLSGIVISPEISAGIKQSGLGFNKRLGERGWREGKNTAVVGSLTLCMQCSFKRHFLRDHIMHSTEILSCV